MFVGARPLSPKAWAAGLLRRVKESPRKGGDGVKAISPGVYRAYCVMSASGRRQTSPPHQNPVWSVISWKQVRAGDIDLGQMFA